MTVFCIATRFWLHNRLKLMDLRRYSDDGSCTQVLQHIFGYLQIQAVIKLTAMKYNKTMLYYQPSVSKML